MTTEITKDQNVIVDGVLYEARRSPVYCDGCAFYIGAMCMQIYAPCFPKDRKDGQPVVFIKSTAQPKAPKRPTMPDASMTLRDHFAGQVLAGLMANTSVIAENTRSGWALVNCTEEQLAQHCYLMADAMMKAREK